MKYIIPTFLLALITCTSFIKANTMDKDVDPRECFGLQIQKTIQFAEQKYQLLPFGSSIIFVDKLESVGVHFRVFKQIPKEDLYVILLDIANFLKESINNDPILQTFMIHYPFTLKDVEVVVFFYNGTSESVTYPDLNVAELTDGSYIFRTVDPQNPNKYKTQIAEPLNRSKNPTSD